MGFSTNRIDQLFAKKKNVLNIYFTAGFPQLTDTARILAILDQAGADLVEIGMPYSDPVADGPTIQASNQVALGSGMTIELLFEQLQGIRQKVRVPIVLMGYVNPVIQYGVEKFVRKCVEVGVDATILPDMPLPEFVAEYQEIYRKANLYNIFLVTPQTSEQRIRQIDEMSNGFIYMVSSNSITGAQEQVKDTQVAYFQRIEAMKLRNPRLIGFGISNHETFAQACQYAEGAIIGSAFIKLLDQSQSLETDIPAFIRKVKGNLI